MSLEVSENIGIAIDGGGIRGIMVAEGLKQLEQQLGAKPLIKCKELKVVAGTSTGAIIAAAIVLGFSAQEIVDLYDELGDEVFSKMGNIRPFGWRIGPFKYLLWPLTRLIWMGKGSRFNIIRKFTNFLLYLLLPARYSAKPLETALRQEIDRKLKERQKENEQDTKIILNSRSTLQDLGNFLEDTGRDLKLIITASDPISRQTQFFKSHSTSYINQVSNPDSRKRKQIRSQNELVKVIMASSTIPTYWDPVTLFVPNRKFEKHERGFVDGGVGSFGNPAAVIAWEFSGRYAAREAIKMAEKKEKASSSHTTEPSKVTIFSFGTGYIDDQIFSQQHGEPANWWALSWARRSIDLFMVDAMREHSQNIVLQYPGIDLRRFQVKLTRDIAADDVKEATRKDLKVLGSLDPNNLDSLGQLIAANRRALRQDDQRNDPEYIWDDDLEEFLE